MAVEMSRRRFLGATAASVIGVQAGAKIALAQPHDAEPMSFEPGPAPFVDMFPAVVHAVRPTGTLLVQSDRDGERSELAPHGFGEWDHRPGDRVTVLEDHEGVRTVRPLVEPVTAVPRGEVRKGAHVECAGRVALVPSDAVADAYRDIGPRHDGRAVWLLSSGEGNALRVFGVVEPS
jgi:hypothetical protein